MIPTENQISNLISPANYKNEIRYENGNTFDIVKEILKADKLAARDTRKIARLFKGQTINETASNIWGFVRNYITYEKDPEGTQRIKSPARLWADRAGDCKSMSLFVASILRNLAIPYKFRFVSYSYAKNLTHVYTVALDEPRNQQIIIDTVFNAFNKEQPFTYKKEYNMTTRQSAPSYSQVAGIGRISLKEAINKQYLITHVPNVLLLAPGRLGFKIILQKNVAFLGMPQGYATMLNQIITEHPKVKNVLINVWYNLGGQKNGSDFLTSLSQGKNKSPLRLNIKEPLNAKLKTYGIGTDPATATIAVGSATISATGAAAIIIAIGAAIGLTIGLPLFFKYKGQNNEPTNYTENQIEIEKAARTLENEGGGGFLTPQNKTILIGAAAFLLLMKN
jgi:hypothetical protein